MKNVIRNAMTLILISLVACFMLIACAGPVSAEEDVIGNGGGLITVTIGGETARKTVSWANGLDSSQLTHTITVSGGQGGPYTATGAQGGGGIASFSVVPGQWKISVEARYSEDLVAEGSDTVQIKKGNNGTKIIKMKAPVSAPLPNCVVNFDSNGGSYVASQTVKKFNKATWPTPPTRSDFDYEHEHQYEFDDWYTDRSFTSQYNFNAPVIADITLYARWR
jgi:uncharacterized repeat protein (TIGR02543 family)